MLKGLQELQHAQAEASLVVCGRLLEAAFQGLRALGQLTVEQKFLGQRRLCGGGAGRQRQAQSHTKHECQIHKLAHDDSPQLCAVCYCFDSLSFLRHSAAWSGLSQAV